MIKPLLGYALSMLTLVAAAAHGGQSTSPTQEGALDATINEFANASDLKNDPEAQKTINLMCGKGVKPPPGFVGSLQWYRKAADLGSAQAQFYLGGMYETGRRVLRDYKRAAQWYHQAAMQGHVMAQVTLGYMYETGRGVAPDYQRAITWYRKAADQGSAMAQYNIGTLYENGEGVVRDEVMAAQWYRKAAAQGYALAVNKLAEIEGVEGVPASNADDVTSESTKIRD